MNKLSIFAIFLMILILVSCDSQPVKRDGEMIYFQSCVSCHERGQAGAPIRGDQKTWQSRLEKGKDVLFKHLKDGYKTMPPRGACFDCSDKELEMVLEFLISNNK